MKHDGFSKIKTNLINSVLVESHGQVENNLEKLRTKIDKKEDKNVQLFI